MYLHGTVMPPLGCHIQGQGGCFDNGTLAIWLKKKELIKAKSYQAANQIKI